MDLDGLITLFNNRQIPAAMVYDGNATKSVVLLPIDPRLVAYCDIEAKSVSIQGVGAYTTGLSIKTYTNVVMIGVSAINTTNYGGRLAYVTLRITKKA